MFYIFSILLKQKKKKCILEEEKFKVNEFWEDDTSQRVTKKIKNKITMLSTDDIGTLLFCLSNHYFREIPTK